MVPQIIRRGLLDYTHCFNEMRAYTTQRDAMTPDQIWLVQHAPVYTLGQAANLDHLRIVESTSTLAKAWVPDDNNHSIGYLHQIPVIKTDRGGQVTYHGPGQLVAYLLLDIQRRKLFVRELVRRIEQAVIDTLSELKIESTRHAGQPGIYLKRVPHIGAKIAALGLKISRGCSYHGLALNIAMDLQPFSWINPCGQIGLETIDLASLGVHVSLATIEERLTQHLLEQLAIPSTEEVK